MKKIIIILLLVGGIALLWFAFGRSNNPTVTNRGETNPETIDQPEQQEDNTIRLIATGDMIPHDTVNLRAEEQNGQAFVGFFDPVRGIINSADLVFCNQEAPSAGDDFGISGYPVFNAPVSFAQGLSAIGCNIINLANNHAGDKGTAAIERTLDVWRPLNPYAISGANRSADEQVVPAFFDYLGKTFAFVAFAEFNNNKSLPPYAVNIFSDQLVDTLMKKASSEADFVIVSAHWGIEGQQLPSDFQKQWANKLTAAGADLIIGTGPHILQTVDKIAAGGNSSLVYYSLGNGLSTQLQPDELFGGFAVVDLEVNDNEVRIAEQGLAPVYMHYSWSPAQAASEDLLARDNLKLMPLDQANNELFRAQQLNVSLKTQTENINKLVNQNIDVKIYQSTDF